MTEDDVPPAAKIAALADALGVALPPEHLEEAARGWRLLAPHRAAVRGVRLGPEAEPAPVFRP